MTENIMFYPAIILMIVEVCAVVFLIRAWFRAKKEAEVVHGRWVNPYMNRYGHPCHCCSVCGFKASYQDKNYCPNCGAKMDGDGNG